MSRTGSDVVAGGSGRRAPGLPIGSARRRRFVAAGFVAWLAVSGGAGRVGAESGADAAPAGPRVEAAQDAGRIVLTPEQRETLRLAREAEARKLLGLAPDAPLPSHAELTDAQRETIRAAREAEMRRVLGLGPGEAIPDRSSATDEQRRKIVAAHEARLREALGLAPDAPLSAVPTEQATPPAKQGEAQ
jgi:hypothetical protein